MTTCEACGSAVPGDIGFCPVCAAPLPEQPEADQVVDAAEPVQAEPERPSLWRRLVGFRNRASAPGATSSSTDAGPASALPAAPPQGPPVAAPSPPAPPLAGPSPVAVEPTAPSGPIIAAVPGFSRPAATPDPVTPPALDPGGAAAEEDASDVDRTRLAAPAERGDVILVLPGDERLTVSGDGVLGRNPAAPVGDDVAHLVPVSDPTRSVSKTHLAFGLDSVGLWVKDLHSTNGTAVVSPDGTRTLLTPGLAVHVMPGDVVVVGDVEVGVTR